MGFVVNCICDGGCGQAMPAAFDRDDETIGDLKRGLSGAGWNVPVAPDGSNGVTLICPTCLALVQPDKLAGPNLLGIFDQVLAPWLLRNVRGGYEEFDLSERTIRIARQTFERVRIPEGTEVFVARAPIDVVVLPDGDHRPVSMRLIRLGVGIALNENLFADKVARIIEDQMKGHSAFFFYTPVMRRNDSDLWFIRCAGVKK